MYNIFTLYDCHSFVSCADHAPANLVWAVFVACMMLGTTAGVVCLLWLVGAMIRDWLRAKRSAAQEN